MNNLIQSKKQLEKLARIKKEQDKADEFFMRKAIKKARLALKKGEIPVGAVIVKDGRVVSFGENKKESKNCAVYHAEINAVTAASKKLGWRLDGCEIYVTLEPCAMCAGAIVSSRIKRVVFGASENKSGAFGSRFDFSKDSGLNFVPEVKGGVLAEECAVLMSEFFSAKRQNAVKHD